MQRDLAAKLASQGGLEVVSFRHFDCLLFARGEVLKMFMPESRRMLFGTPSDRMVSGSLRLLFEKDLKRLHPPSKRFEFSESIASIQLGNFPGLIPYSILSGDVAHSDFLTKIGQLLASLPDDQSGWEKQFGEGFFSLPGISRMSAIIRDLRGVAEQVFPVRSSPLPFTVTIESPPETRG